ncbi:hypothetical protein P9314_27890, partial [Paenibacillus validus]|nr:hypothetical protein [Paenibacillus validus]
LEAWRAEGIAIVMVTHDPGIVRTFATRVWEVRDGKLAADMLPAAYEATGRASGTGSEPQTVKVRS